jgi:hypothetical protein
MFSSIGRCLPLFAVAGPDSYPSNTMVKYPVHTMPKSTTEARLTLQDRRLHACSSILGSSRALHIVAKLPEEVEVSFSFESLPSIKPRSLPNHDLFQAQGNKHIEGRDANH